MKLDPSISKKHPSGAWEVSDIIDGYLVRRTYYGVGKRSALAAFKAEFSPKRVKTNPVKSGRLREGDSVRNLSHVTAYTRLKRGVGDSLFGAGDTRVIPSNTHGYIVEIGKQRGSNRALVRWTLYDREFFGWHDLDRLTKEPRQNPVTPEGRELFLFITNDGELYRSQASPIILNLAKKLRAGKYKPDLAVKLWCYLADSGAKKYTFEHDDPGGARVWQQVKGYGIFTVAHRMEAAKELHDYYLEQVVNKAGVPVIVKQSAS